MQRSLTSRYWLFQSIGWGLFTLINIFFAFLFSKLDLNLLLRLLFDVEIGILFTHLMRQAITRSGVLMKSLQQQVIIFIVLTVIFAFFIASVVSPFEEFCNVRYNAKGGKIPYRDLLYLNFGQFSPLLLIWNFVYFMFHFVMKSRKQQMDTIKLEALVRQLELKTIKAHINPHFIFNALNSIRALIDENPARARKAITELSNILRSSLNAEKGETVSLSEELKIVKDYLALENMRFEDRLKVEYDVDDDTLDQQVPPMMLQTLVENAIKHGISKQVRGGVVKIISDFRENYHELAVQNTGYLNGSLMDNGFGLSSTQDRLHLLYGEKAKFEISQVNPDLVEARVLIPVTFTNVD
ncbi:MAG: sensor histidine kinase [Flavisolibacter sp.]